MAAGWLGGAGVSATEPARLLLTAGACGGRSPHACHGSGSFFSGLAAGLAPAPAPLHAWHSNADAHGDRSHTSGVSWFSTGAGDVGGVGRGYPTFYFIPLLGAVFHGRGPAVLPPAVLGPRSELQDAG